MGTVTGGSCESKHGSSAGRIDVQYDPEIIKILDNMVAIGTFPGFSDSSGTTVVGDRSMTLADEIKEVKARTDFGILAYKAMETIIRQTGIERVKQYYEGVLQRLGNRYD